MHAQAEATRACEREILRLVGRYGAETVETAFGEVQNYVERLTRARIAALPDVESETDDYLDLDPAGGEGLIPIRVKMTISGDRVHYDLNGSHPAVGSFLNSGYGATTSAVYAGTKTFFPDVPLNSGFYRAVTVDLGPEGSVINAPWPIAVTGFCSGPYEKIMNSIFELWSRVMPERALACSFNLEYLLVGGRDARQSSRPIYMWYDWMAGGWGGRNGARRLERHVADVRRRPGGAAGGGPGAAVARRHVGPRDQDRLGRPRPVPRRLRRREGRPADRGRGHRHVVLLRPRPVDHVGHRGRPAVAAARRLARPGRRRRAVPRSRLLQRPDPGRLVASPGRRPAAAATATRWSATSPAWSRTSPTTTSRSSAPRSTTASWCASSTPSSASTPSTRPPPPAMRARDRAACRGWLAEDADDVARALPRGRARRARPRAPLRRDRRLGQRRAPAERTTAEFREMLGRRAVAFWPES